MSRLGMIVALLQACASVEALIAHDWRRALIYAGFAFSGAVIAYK